MTTDSRSAKAFSTEHAILWLKGQAKHYDEQMHFLEADAYRSIIATIEALARSEKSSGKVCLRPCNGPGGIEDCDYPKCMGNPPNLEPSSFDKPQHGGRPMTLRECAEAEEPSRATNTQNGICANCGASVDPFKAHACGPQYTDEKGNFWTLDELLADLDGGDYLYLTPKMCRDLAALLRSSTSNPPPHYASTLRTVAHHLHDMGEDSDGHKLEDIADDLERRSLSASSGVKPE